MLLDRYGGVDDEGHYQSPIESKNARFFTMLGTLVRGRICVGGGAASAARKALSIAVRYGGRAPAVPPPGSRARRSCCWTTSPTSAGSCPTWHGPTPTDSRRTSWRCSCSA